MYNIYQVSDKMRHILDMAAYHAEKNDGELSDEICNMLDDAEYEKELVVLDMCRAYKNLIAEKESIESEASKMIGRANSCTKRANSIKNALSKYAFGEKYKDATAKMHWSSSKSVQINNESLLPKEAFVEKTTVTASKTEIKKLINFGKIGVDAAEIVKNEYPIIG